MSEVVAVTPSGGSTRQESVAHIKRHKLANCNVPLVHGRSNPPINTRNRLTTHQRNHSLDFRYVNESSRLSMLHTFPENIYSSDNVILWLRLSTYIDHPRVYKCIESYIINANII